MARAHHYRRRTKHDVDESDMTTFLNLMVVLIPFLLLTAVFSRISTVDIDLPSASGGSRSADPQFRVEVIVREAGLEITNGTDVIAALPKVDEAYDLAQLSELLLALKQERPEKEDASVLLEPRIEYDHLIQVMDTVKSVEMGTGGRTARMALFPVVSIGEAP